MGVDGSAEDVEGGLVLMYAHLFEGGSKGTNEAVHGGDVVGGGLNVVGG